MDKILIIEDQDGLLNFLYRIQLMIQRAAGGKATGNQTTAVLKYHI